MNDMESEAEIREFIRQFADDPQIQEMLLFLGRHPYTRFNKPALVDSLNMNPKVVDNKVKLLAEKGLVTKIQTNGSAVYSLTAAEPYHDLVRRTAQLTPRQRQLI